MHEDDQDVAFWPGESGNKTSRKRKGLSLDSTAIEQAVVSYSQDTMWGRNGYVHWTVSSSTFANIGTSRHRAIFHFVDYLTASPCFFTGKQTNEILKRSAN